MLYTKWRDPGEEPKLHLFGQLKRITKQWLDTCLVCKGGTYPAQLMYQELADMACERITAGITSALVGERPIKALLDPYNPTGSTMHVNFTTSKTSRWQTDARRCHLNWVILDSDWEAEFCRVAESHPRVQAYVKNHNLGLEVPYRYGSETRRYLPDFIVLVDDGHGDDDLLHLIVEIKGYRREDAKEKKATMLRLLGAWGNELVQMPGFGQQPDNRPSCCQTIRGRMMIAVMPGQGLRMHIVGCHRCTSCFRAGLKRHVLRRGHQSPLAHHLNRKVQNGHGTGKTSSPPWVDRAGRYLSHLFHIRIAQARHNCPVLGHGANDRRRLHDDETDTALSNYEDMAKLCTHSSKTLGCKPRRRIRDHARGSASVSRGCRP